MTFEKAVFELWYSIHGTNPSNYHTRLYELIGKADGENRAKLRQVYPQEVRAFEEWQEAESEMEFFKLYGAIE